MWTAEVPFGSVKFDIRKQTASLNVKNVIVFDGFTVPNALNSFHSEGHVDSVIESLRLEWSGTTKLLCDWT